MIRYVLMDRIDMKHRRISKLGFKVFKIHTEMQRKEKSKLFKMFDNMIKY